MENECETSILTTKKKVSIKKLTCSVCFEQIIEPVRQPCKHVYCLWCFKYRSELKKKCEKCKDIIEQIPRFYVKIDKSVRKTIEKNFPNEFKSGKKTLMKGNMFIGTKLPVIMYYGYKRVNSDYKFYIELFYNKELIVLFVKSVEFVVNQFGFDVFEKKDYPYYQLPLIHY